MNLHLVLYGCETLSLTLREEHRPRVFENRVLRIFGPKRDEVTGEWRMLHNEDLSWFVLPNIITIKSRRMRWEGHIAWIGEKRNAYRLLVGKPEGNRPLGTPRRRWVDNITMDWSDSGYGELLSTRHWTFGFQKMLGSYRVSYQLGIPRVVLSSIELVS
jgi:hypothetical protein